jgi:RNA polymerase sigma-70 factor (ECF subfamily)
MKGLSANTRKAFSMTTVRQVSWTDQQWATLMAEGNERAFAAFYDAFAPALYRRLSRMTGDPTQAEDCLQLVFTKALQTIGNYRGDGKLEAWLERIATHVAMDQYRKKYRWRNIMERWSWSRPKEEDISEEGLPEEIFMKEELRQEVWSVLDQLEPRKRMAVILCDLEGMTIDQAATQMGIPQGTAASRLRFGREEFRKRMIASCRNNHLNVGDWLDE